jgi:transcriptional regulator with XRE-family HTH domain
MPKTLRELSRHVEARSKAEGPAGEAELAALRAQARIARIFSERRLERGLTQQQLAALSGIPQSEISKVENARANPTVATLAALARPLGLELGAYEVTTPRATGTTAVWSVSEAIAVPATAPAFRRPLHRKRSAH